MMVDTNLFPSLIYNQKHGIFASMKIYDRAFDYLITKRKKKNGKCMKLSYSKLKIQNHLLSEDFEITNIERKKYIPV